MSALQEKVVDAYVAWDAIGGSGDTEIDDDVLDGLLEAAFAADEAIAAEPIKDLTDAFLAIQYAASMLSRWEPSSRDEEIMRSIMARAMEFFDPEPVHAAA